MTDLKTLREACVPRDEVLTGELTDEMFAARLNDVVRGRAHPIYQDADLFFANTYPPERVQSFFREVAGRLSGADQSAASAFRLDTTFGGGKTHTLIGLYHLATSQIATEQVHRLGLSQDKLPSSPVRVVSVVGGDLDPANGVAYGSVRVHHLWGEIAYRLRGPEGYELVRNSDVQGTAPAIHFMDQLAGTDPVLILLDEPAEYMRRMGTQAGQLPAFLKSLTEWVTAAASRTVLVFTLAWNPETQSAADAFAPETRELVDSLAQTFQELQSVVNRPVRTVTLAQSEDIAPILRQRLFQTVDDIAASEVAQAYSQALARASDRGTPILSEATRATYQERLQRSYPFHPEIIRLLDGKLSTIPNFQRTRGALRLLARVIRRLWTGDQSDATLLTPGLMDLSDPDLLDEVTGRLDRAPFRSVAAYDVADPHGQAHAQVIDAERLAGHPSYTQRLAATIFLHSLTEPPARGIDLRELMTATLTPDADPAHLEKALEHLREAAWHLDYEGPQYYFRTEPSLNKIVQDETQNVSFHDARIEVERRVRQLYKDAGLTVRHFPDAPEDLADEPRGRLAICHWDTATFSDRDQSAPAHVRELWEYVGIQRDYRRYRNTLFFLVADRGQAERMANAARRWIALDRLSRDKRKLDDYKLSTEHRKRLDEWRASAELDLRVAITRAYRHLFYPVTNQPSQTSDTPFSPFAHYALHIEDQGGQNPNHARTVLEVLRKELEKVRTAEDPPLPAPLVRQQTFGQGEGSIPLQSLFHRFAERARLPLLLEPTYFKAIVRGGIQQGVWLYYDAGQNLAYDDPSHLPDIVIDDAHEAVLPQAAKDRGIPVYRREKPQPGSGPDPGSHGNGRTKGDTKDGPSPSTQFETKEIEATGEPRRALADLAALAHDAHWKAIGRMVLHWDGQGGDVAERLSAIQTILGQSPAASATLAITLACEYPDGATWETTFSGPTGRYQALASTLQSQVGQANAAHVDVTMTLRYEKGLAPGGTEFEELRETLDLAGLNRIKGKAYPLEEATP